MTFLQAKKQLKTLAKGKYHCLKYELSDHNRKDSKVTALCSVYIDGLDWHNAPTWEKALAYINTEIEGTDLKEAPKMEVVA